MFSEDIPIKEPFEVPVLPAGMFDAHKSAEPMNAVRFRRFVRFFHATGVKSTRPGWTAIPGEPGAHQVGQRNGALYE